MAFSYTDPTIVGTTTVKAAHLTELRAAANAARGTLGQAATAFTGTINAGTTIQRVHLVEIRSVLDAVRAALGLTPINYTDPTITAGSTKVKGAHITELRTGMQ